MRLSTVSPKRSSDHSTFISPRDQYLRSLSCVCTDKMSQRYDLGRVNHYNSAPVFVPLDVPNFAVWIESAWNDTFLESYVHDQ